MGIDKRTSFKWHFWKANSGVCVCVCVCVCVISFISTLKLITVLRSNKLYREKNKPNKWQSLLGWKKFMIQQCNHSKLGMNGAIEMLGSSRYLLNVTIANLHLFLFWALRVRYDYILNGDNDAESLLRWLLQDWVNEMAAHVKSIDNYHLLEIGLEGFYGDSKKESNPGSYLFGTDFISNNQIPHIDFATIHLYPEQW